MNNLIELIFSGQKADIFCYKKADGRSPTKEFIKNLDNSEKIKLFSLFKRFATFGEIQNELKFKSVGDKIFEFKSNNIRVLCFFMPGTRKKLVVTTHGFIKKQQKLPPGEKERALSIYNKIIQTEYKDGK